MRIDLLIEAISTISALIAAYYLRRTILAVYKTPLLTAISSPESQESVAILIPVRNEAGKMLREHLDSLILQSHSRSQIIAIDDNSTDDSANILKEYVQPNRFTLISGKPLSEGWCGKTYALSQGRAVVPTQCEWILMVDADVILHPDAIAYALHCATSHGLDALCVLPRVRMDSFWEKLVVPIMVWLSLMRVTPQEANDLSSKKCFGYGNFMLVRRTAHDAIGGFERYKNDVLDDSAVMELLKNMGFRPMIVYGDDVLEARMYQNLNQIVAGAAKNSFRAISFSIVRLLDVAAKELIGVFWPLLHFFLFWGSYVSDYAFAAASLSWLLTLAMMIVIGRCVHATWPFFMLYPLGHVVALYIMTYSAFASLFQHHVFWKGRSTTVLSTEK